MNDPAYKYIPSADREAKLKHGLFTSVAMFVAWLILIVGSGIGVLIVAAGVGGAAIAPSAEETLVWGLGSAVMGVGWIFSSIIIATPIGLLAEISKKLSK